MAITLEQRGLSSAGKPSEAPPLSASQDGGGFLSSLSRRVKPLELLFFTSQLSLMLEIGTPVKVALEAAREQTGAPAFKEVIQALLQDIREGRQLSEAMNRHPKVFDGIFTSMIRAGETGGFLSEIVERLVEILEKREALKTQLRTALTYPLILCVVTFLVVGFILVYVLPKFTTFFEGKEHILPFATRFLIALSDSLKTHWWVYLLSGAALAAGLKYFKESRTGQILIDKLFVSGPLIARLSNKIYTCQLLRILGNLMESHVPLIEALEVTRTTIKNRYFQQFIAGIIEHVREGGKFSQPFASNPYVLESVKRMVATGEEAGNLAKVMLRLALFYDTAVDRELKHISSMIEPVALIFMGGIVGLVVSSVVLPLFRLASAMH
jgi:type IV pilus assembly protein PilC